MTRNLPASTAGRGRPARTRHAILGLSLLLCWALAGCGDPDDGDGGGGGYVSPQAIEQTIG